MEERLFDTLVCSCGSVRRTVIGGLRTGTANVLREGQAVMREAVCTAKRFPQPRPTIRTASFFIQNQAVTSLSGTGHSLDCTSGSGKNRPIFPIEKLVIGNKLPVIGNNKPVIGNNTLVIGNNGPEIGKNRPVFGKIKSGSGKTERSCQENICYSSNFNEPK
jgi:hypothetical protein